MQLMKKKENDRWLMRRLGRKDEEGEGEDADSKAAGSLGGRISRPGNISARGMRTVDRGERQVA
jgi:hypothetical protein